MRKSLPLVLSSGTVAIITLSIGLLTSTVIHAQTAEKRFTADRSVIEEVIVTARKREESLQETPVAVTAISGDSLRAAGINNIAELTNSVPSLQISKGQSNQVFIRGIGQRASTLKVDPAVGVYVDGVFIPRSDGQFLNSLELASVQVLRGPQGTLFGKNNTGGALVFTLQKPNENFEGHIDGTLGNYGTAILKGAVNLPLSDTFATRLAISSTHNDGYVDDISQGKTNNSDNRQSAIGQFLWDVSDDSALTGMLYYGRTRERFPANNCEIINPDALLINGVGLLYAGDTDPQNPHAYQDACNTNNRDNLPDLTTNMGQHQMNVELDTVLGGLTGDWQLSENYSAKLILGAGYQVKGPVLENDTDAGNQQFVENFFAGDSKRDWTSIEAQINGSAFDSKLNYTTGLFAMLERNTEQHMLMLSFMGIDPQKLAPLLAARIPSLPSLPGSVPVVGGLGGPLNTYTEFDLENTTLAGFAQGSWDFTDALQLTVGMRYTVETRQAKLTTVFTDNQAVVDRLTASNPRFSALDPAMPLFSYAGSWLEDPVGIAMSYFPDQNGDGYFDAPLDFDNAVVDKKKHAFTKLTPMVSLSYIVPDEMLNDDILSSAMTYVTYSTGFKSGFFEPRGVDGLQQIEPEVVNNAELGIKIDAFDRTLRVNVAAYNMLYENMQLIQTSTDSAGTLATVFANVGESLIQGIEAELTWLPSVSWQVNMSFSDNSYSYKEFDDRDIFKLFVGSSGTIDRTDERLPVSPDTTASMALQYILDSSVGTFTPRIDISYKSDVYLGFDHGAWLVYQQDEDKVTAPAYSLINLRFSWLNTKGDLSMSAYIKNAADKRFDIGAVSIGDTLGNFNRVYGEPRMYGVTVRKTF
ncbi:MAG: iron complex outermembrane receptor protein [Bermanella sp.]|jgi:iron complex outermembrane receptor protein